jgi:hypothetical protein
VGEGWQLDARPDLASDSIRLDCPQTRGVSQGELISIKCHENCSLNFQRHSHVPKVQRTARLRPRKPLGYTLGPLKSFRPFQWFVNQSSVAQVILNVAQYLTRVNRPDQAAMCTLANGGPKFQTMQRRKEYWIPVATRAMTQSCGGMLIGNVKGYQTRRVEIGFQRRNRDRTWETPGMGFDEIRLSRALNAAADFPGRFLRAGTILTHGLPRWVTMTVSPACAKSPMVSKPSTTSCLVTVFIGSKIASISGCGNCEVIRAKPARVESRPAQFLPKMRTHQLAFLETIQVELLVRRMCVGIR